MVRALLIGFIFLSIEARADLFDFASGKKALQSKIPDLVEKLKSTEVKDDPSYEDGFNQMVKAIENKVEEEKLFCSGESADASGKVIAPAQKQLCMRELKSQYVEATEVIFEMKKKYLGLVHQRQVQKLTDIQKKIKADIEKNF